MDPFSIVVGIAGLVALADGLATKGYQYVRAAKNCEKEVNQVLAELDLLGGVLRRLQKWVEEEEKTDSHESNILAEIDYIDECQMTRREIRDILKVFDKKAKSLDVGLAGLSIAGSSVTGATTSESTPKNATKKPNIFQRLSGSDLKWPLSKSETAGLIERLERHKATCIIALSTGTASDTSKILREQAIVKAHLVEQGNNVKKILEMTIADEYGESAKKVFEWFSPVNPLPYHQAARTIYQRGTGRWFVSGPEFIEWQEATNSALWLYGIRKSGAGKTILSSLIIEETFKLKANSNASGIAYYYCTFRDAATQKPSHILGSFVRQLAEQNEDAFVSCKSFHENHHPAGRPPSLPTEAELGDLLQQMSQHFNEVSLVLDGLDECGHAAGIDRTELIRVLSNLHEHSKGTIRIAIASRKEHDIASCLTQFTSISIAAMSSDLELYIEAEVARRGGGKFRDEDTKQEIIDALSSGAEGMFQWVKCQLDYLFLLPNDAERRKALKSLPPDLPQTYIRILERLDRDLPAPTQLLVRRVLIWLAFNTRGHTGMSATLDLESIATAVSIETDLDAKRHTQPPRPSDIASWCSSLVTVDEAKKSITFSHFSVKEFLVNSLDKVDSPAARKYLLQESRDQAYMAEVCLTYLTSQDLPTLLDFEDDVALTGFAQNFPLYDHAASVVWQYLECSDATAQESNSLRKFFTPLANDSFTFWQQFMICYQVADDVGNPGYHVTWGPLYLAASCRLEKTVLRLLSEGADVNSGPMDRLPLHCAIVPWIDLAAYLWAQPSWDDDEDVDCNLAIIVAMISHEAELNQCIQIHNRRGYQMTADPCAIAFIHNQISACRTLLKNGAKINAEIFIAVLDSIDDTSVLYGYDAIMDLVLSENHIQDPNLRQRLNQLRADTGYSEGEFEQPSFEDSCDLFLAVRYGNESAFRRLLETSPNLEVQDDDGNTALHYAVMYGWVKCVSALLDKGADARALNHKDLSPLLLAYETWEPSDIQEVFEPYPCLRLTSVQFSQLARQACESRDAELLACVISQQENSELDTDLLNDLNTRARCTPAEIRDFQLVAFEDNIPYNRSILRILQESGLAVSRQLPTYQLAKQTFPTPLLPVQQEPQEQGTRDPVLQKLVSLINSWPRRLGLTGIHEEAENVYQDVLKSQGASIEAESPEVLATIRNLAYLVCLRIEPQGAKDLLWQLFMHREMIMAADDSS